MKNTFLILTNNSVALYNLNTVEGHVKQPKYLWEWKMIFI